MAKRSYAAPAAEEAAVPEPVVESPPVVEVPEMATVASEPEPAPEPVPSTVEIVAAPVEPGEPLWAVTFDGMTDIVPARNSGEAWSRVCDSRRQWPSPMKGKVERVEPLPAVP